MTTIRVSEETRTALRNLAHARGESMQEVVAKAVEQFRRQQFFDALDASYAKLQEDREAWESLQHEYAEWETTLGDGLKED
jgi:predicted transcriptional regulator